MNKEEIMIKTLENENQLLKQNLKKEVQKSENLLKNIEELKIENQRQKEICNKKNKEKQIIEERLNRIINSRSYKIYKAFFRR